MGSTDGNGVAVTSLSQPQPPLLVKKLVESAKAPTRGSAFAAGYDLYSAKETVIPAKGKGMVDTGLAIAVPEGTCMFVCLSSLLPKNMLTLKRRSCCTAQWTRL